MSSSLDDVVAYLHQHPGASRNEAMRALSVSARTVRLAEEHLDQRRAVRSRRRRAVALVLLVLGALSAAGWWIYDGVRARRDREHQVAQRAASERAEQEERTLYAAMDQGSDEREQQALQHLGSEQESLRLAAARYLARVSPDPHGERLARLVDDPAPRVRLATLQLLAEIPGSGPARALGSVALDAERPLSERTLALSGLGRRPERDDELARRLLPLLQEDHPAIRAQASAALQGLTGLRPRLPEGPTGLHQAWANALGAGG